MVAGMVVFTAAFFGLFFHYFFGSLDEFDAKTFLFGVFFGALLSTAGAAISFYFGTSIVAYISNARLVDKADDPVLFNVVEEMAIAAGIPAPKIYAIPDESPNAFASGRDPQHAIVAITTGLRKKLTRDELQAVIAHEMAHIKNYDIRLMMLIAVFAGLIVLFSDFFVRNFINGFRLRGGRRTSSGSGKSQNALTAVVAIVSLIFAILAPIIARFLQLAISREREYLADTTAVQFCRNPLALASALKKISLDPEKLEYDNRATEHMYIINPDPKLRLNKADWDSIWSTHPPLIKRISRLNDLAGKTASESLEPENI